MARFRKILTISPVILLAILIALYNQQIFESMPTQYPPAYTATGSAKIDESQLDSHLITPVFAPQNFAQEVQSVIAAQLLTEESENTATVSDSITLTGWVGTEFGENFANETVILYSSTLRAHHSVITNGSGEFVFRDLMPSYDYALKVSPQGKFKRYKKFPIKLNSRREVHNIVLKAIPLGMLTGRISNLYGQPAAGIELLIKTIEIDSWSIRVTTDLNGNFYVTEFPKGSYAVESSGNQLFRASGLKFDPIASEFVNLTIDLGSYQLEGRIYDESGQTFDGANIFLNWSSHKNGLRIRSTRSSSASTDGEFRFTELGPGDHELVVSAWRLDTSGQMIKQTLRQTINVGVDSAELDIFINTL